MLRVEGVTGEKRGAYVLVSTIKVFKNKNISTEKLNIHNDKFTGWKFTEERVMEPEDR